MISSNSSPPRDLFSSTTNSDVFQDSIANICWYPCEPSRMLAVSSWDSKIRLFSASQAEGRVIIEEGTTFSREYPCLALAWSNPSSTLIAGFLDGTIEAIDSTTGTTVTTIGKHDDVVQDVFHLEQLQLICSVSHDKTMKFWDLRNNSSPVKTCPLGDKAVCADVLFPHMAIGLSNQTFLAFDINNTLRTSTILQHLTSLGADSPISDISLSKELAIGIGSYSGRSALSWLKFPPHDPNAMSMNGTYCFKGHKLEPGQHGNTTNLKIMYPINAVGMHPKKKDTYFTAGRDGWVHFWNITKRSRIGGFMTGEQFTTGVPVTKARYSPDGEFLAYGIGYDWSNGIEGAKSHPVRLGIHKVQSNELVQ